MAEIIKKVDASNVFLKMKTDIYETLPVQLSDYKKEDGTYQTFQEKYPSAHVSNDSSMVCFACIIRAEKIPFLQGWAKEQNVSLGFGLTSDEICYLDIATIYEMLETPEWKPDEIR